jgi:SAM-dependent methyltransferase
MPHFDINYYSKEVKRKTKKISIEKKFLAWSKGRAFYDGKRSMGYGGYKYDKRWLKLLPKIIKRYKLNSKSKVLDLGCKKGFLIYDLKQLIPGIECRGVEDHIYPIKYAKKDVKSDIKYSKYYDLPFKNKYFDFIIGFSSIYTYNFGDLISIFKEIKRVSKNNKKIYITVAAYENKSDFLKIMDWTTLSSTILSKKDWFKFFRKVKYNGDYFFTTPKVLGLK